MNTNLKVTSKNIDVKDFDNIKRVSIFERKPYDRRFVLLTYAETAMKLSWQSDEITPTVLELNEGIYFVGVDLNYAVVNFITGEIELSELVDTFILTAFSIGGILVVVSEMKLFLHDVESLKQIEEISLPDIYVDSVVSDGALTIECMNGEYIKVSLEPNEGGKKYKDEKATVFERGDEKR